MRSRDATDWLVPIFLIWLVVVGAVVMIFDTTVWTNAALTALLLPFMLVLLLGRHFYLWLPSNRPEDISARRREDVERLAKKKVDAD